MEKSHISYKYKRSLFQNVCNPASWKCCNLLPVTIYTVRMIALLQIGTPPTLTICKRAGTAFKMVEALHKSAYVTCKFHLLQQFVNWPSKTSEIFCSCCKMWCVLPRYPMVTMWWGCPEVREHANHPPIVAVSASKGCFPCDVSTVSILGPIIMITKV